MYECIVGMYLIQMDSVRIYFMVPQEIDFIVFSVCCVTKPSGNYVTI